MALKYNLDELVDSIEPEQGKEDTRAKNKTASMKFVSLTGSFESKKALHEFIFAKYAKKILSSMPPNEGYNHLQHVVSEVMKKEYPVIPNPDYDEAHHSAHEKGKYRKKYLRVDANGKPLEPIKGLFIYDADTLGQYKIFYLGFVRNGITQIELWDEGLTKEEVEEAQQIMDKVGFDAGNRRNKGTVIGSDKKQVVGAPKEKVAQQEQKTLKQLREEVEAEDSGFSYDDLDEPEEVE